MFVINPDPYSLPSFRIGPFTTRDLSQNHKIFLNNKIDNSVFNDYILKRFGTDCYITINGREAINLALQTFNLRSTDLVTIITTSQNYYISSCVTNEIEKFCQWNREIVDETKLILVNHEFGFVYPEMDNLVSLGIPIIEDCCTTFFSQDNAVKVGKYSDFAVYSFPKFFPIQVGGLLVNNSKKQIIEKSAISVECEIYCKKVVSYHLDNLAEILEKRRMIYYYAIECFVKEGFTQRFIVDESTVPSVIMLNNNMIINDLPALKKLLWTHGIQSSIFYGEDAFFLPCHQNLNKSDIDYFLFLIHNFLENQ